MASRADTLSDVLRAVRLRGALFFTVDAVAPWVAEAPDAQQLEGHILPGVDHLIEYHAVTRGSCWGGLVGEAPIRLEEGDLIAFPQGGAHVISSAPGMRGAPDMSLPGRLRQERLPLLLRLGTGGQDRAALICGFLGCDTRPFNPLLSVLPRTIHLQRQTVERAGLHQLLQLALEQSQAGRAGGEAVLSRLSEVLFMELVRLHLESLPADSAGWLAGLRDESVGKALAEVHAAPSRGFSVEELARSAGMSRSGFVERFTQLLGIPPMRYLAQWRMQLAAGHLAAGTLGLAEIADLVGYGSEAALSRAFKRQVGMAPADFRKSKRL
jgi:AraC-like DNA-binding protein